jgi:hypothetical protein
MARIGRFGRVSNGPPASPLAAFRLAQLSPQAVSRGLTPDTARGD